MKHLFYAGIMGTSLVVASITTLCFVIALGVNHQLQAVRDVGILGLFGIVSFYATGLILTIKGSKVAPSKSDKEAR